MSLSRGVLTAEQSSKAAASTSKGKGMKSTVKAVCRHCGKSNHTFSTCKHREYKCKICKQVGHLAQVCQTNVDVKNLKVTDEQPFNEFDLINIKTDLYEPPVMISVKINDNLVNMEVDLGAAGSIVKDGFFKSFLSNCKLDLTNTKN